ncbi:MAG TPA: non-homologous end-joining DNA ligase, partial [Patescibacteria group bacterium]|nr:non-homologous end-joining DNA ligase [Patescibacteria group bacterium]
MKELMLAQQGSIEDLNNKEFIFEPKFDGTRVLIYKKGKNIKLINRRNNNITYRYPELEDIWKNFRADGIFDGELVVLGKNNLPDFNLLQKREQLESRTKIEFLSHSHPATIFIFDVLKAGNKNLTNLQLMKRKEVLKKQVISSSKISLVPFTKDGKKLWKEIKKLKMEGVMAKRANGKYENRRSSSWLKIKNTKTIDAVIIGYTKEKREISALVLGAYHNKKLIYIGRVASGLSERAINELSKKLIPAKQKIEIDTPKKIFFVKPKIIVEIKFLEITKDLKLRAPSLLR